MKNILTIVIVSALVSFGTYKITSKDNDNNVTQKESAYDRVLRTGTLRCGYGMWPPSMLVKDVNSGELSGAIYDIIEEMGKNLNIKIEWAEETGWGTWPEGLRSGRFDAFCASAYQTASRGRVVRFTSPLFYNAVQAYARYDDARFDNGIDQLNSPEFKLSTMDGEISAQIASKFFPKAKIVSVPQTSEFDRLLLNVSSGKADIVFNEPSLMNDFITKNPGLLKRVTKKPFQLFSVSFAVDINEANLAEMMDAALTEMQNNGIIEQILTLHHLDSDTFIRLAHPYQSENRK